MSKAYIVTAYRSISDPNKVGAYIKLAGPAIEAMGGKFLARSNPATIFEAGIAQRTVIVEFDNLEQAVAAYNSPAYCDALRELEGGAIRDVRVVEGG